MFFNDLYKHSGKLALIDGSVKLTYSQLDETCTKLQSEIEDQIGKTKQLILLKAANTSATLIAYLSCLRLGHAIMLVNPDIEELQLNHIQQNFSASLLVCGTENQTTKLIKYQNTQPVTRAELALLLPTSGSTGGAKHVALSYQNLDANAESIGQYLPIEANDLTLCALPFFYSYGLSVINSHLRKGACCVFTRSSPMTREYWQLFELHKISSFAGVPFVYDMLLRLRFTQKDLPHLRYFTQAGGKLDEEKVKILANYARSNGKQFYVMYGQTEATARMAYLAPDQVAIKPSAIGKAIPGGKFELIGKQGQVISAVNQVGELKYFGPNIMLGYVNQDSDFDRLAPLPFLMTGDLAFRDQQGDYFISGRKSRLIKLFGKRIELDEVESELQAQGLITYCGGSDKGLIVAVTQQNLTAKDLSDADLQRIVADKLAVHISAVEVRLLTELPRTVAGKKDYSSLLNRTK
ncbi:AMP-binding protein [Aliiglaciecola sp. LCG003]|uniref:AMP-binding protein n=1 Tax=Aliiglaciecola sp. LCG003 TaxID=3053655 RepID=UPI00257313E9|nr:AMP-binding protein [Aliiglaciecola sp. LCG003]WJG10576.1 AMP-binding protein [Aliiglaciecola sp. LCG003]